MSATIYNNSQMWCRGTLEALTASSTRSIDGHLVSNRCHRPVRRKVLSLPIGAFPPSTPCDSCSTYSTSDYVAYSLNSPSCISFRHDYHLPALHRSPESVNSQTCGAVGVRQPATKE